MIEGFWRDHQEMPILAQIFEQVNERKEIGVGSTRDHGLLFPMCQWENNTLFSRHSFSSRNWAYGGHNLTQDDVCHNIRVRYLCAVPKCLSWKYRVTATCSSLLTIFPVHICFVNKFLASARNAVFNKQHRLPCFWSCHWSYRPLWTSCRGARWCWQLVLIPTSPWARVFHKVLCGRLWCKPWPGEPLATQPGAWE